MAKEGCGSCNGVNYTYAITNNSWFGHCNCRVHRYFLKAGPLEFSTKDLAIAGRKWQLRFSHSEDGLLGAQLILISKSSVKVQYSVSVLNHIDPNNDIENCGGSALFHPKTAGGYSKICPIHEIRERCNGFLSDDVFVVHLKIRQKIPENENFKISSCSSSCTATWKLRHVHQLSPTELVSDDFGMGNTKWYLSIHPGDRLAKREHVGVYLHSLNEFSIKVAVRLTVVNHKSRKRNLLSDLVHAYNAPSGYGWNQVLEAKALQDESLGFLSNGWVTIIAEISQRANVHQTASGQGQLRLRGSVTQQQEARCVVCLAEKQTSGFVHGKIFHKCVCEGCCKLLFEKNFRCPVCAEKADSIILNNSL